MGRRRLVLLATAGGLALLVGSGTAVLLLSTPDEVPAGPVAAAGSGTAPGGVPAAGDGDAADASDAVEAPADVPVDPALVASRNPFEALVEPGTSTSGTGTSVTGGSTVPAPAPATGSTGSTGGADPAGCGAAPSGTGSTTSAVPDGPPLVTRLTTGPVRPVVVLAGQPGTGASADGAGTGCASA